METFRFCPKETYSGEALFVLSGAEFFEVPFVEIEAKAGLVFWSMFSGSRYTIPKSPDFHENEVRTFRIYKRRPRWNDQNDKGKFFEFPLLIVKKKQEEIADELFRFDIIGIVQGEMSDACEIQQGADNRQAPPSARESGA